MDTASGRRTAPPRGKELPAALLAAEDLYALRDRDALLPIDVRLLRYARAISRRRAALARPATCDRSALTVAWPWHRDTMAAVLGALGLPRPGPAVVLYDDRGGCEAAPARWLMQVYGHSDVRIPGRRHGYVDRRRAQHRDTAGRSARRLPITSSRGRWTAKPWHLAGMQPAWTPRTRGGHLFPRTNTLAGTKRGAARPGTAPQPALRSGATRWTMTMASACAIRTTCGGSPRWAYPRRTPSSPSATRACAAPTPPSCCARCSASPMRNYDGSWTE